MQTRMMTGSRLTLTVVAAVALLAGALVSASGAQPAPSVLLHRADGTTVRLEDFKGKVVLVDFWASWCVPCRASFPALDALYQRERNRGLEVLAINVDEQRKSADAFLAGRPHVMPVVFDPKGESAQAFNVRGMPSSVLIDRTSHIRFTHMGYSTTVFDSYQREIDQLLAEQP
jgi:cytochrome c biogenesis protein CcmG, thiol:disulfide interchange protein DsbE